MNKRIAMLLGMIGFAVVFAGCGYLRAPVVPPVAAITVYSAPLDTDLGGEDVGVHTGEASCWSILGIVAFGDSSIHAAAADGHLDRIDHVDYDYVNVLFGVFTKFTTVVVGE